MPRVLRIMNRLAIGGPILNAAYLSKYLPPEFDTLFLIGEKESHEKSAADILHGMDIPYQIIKGMGRSLNPLKDIKAYQQLKEVIRQFQPDIIHTHAAKPGTLGRLAGHSLNVPVLVHTFHGHIFHSYFHPLKTKAFIQLERYLAKKSTAIVAISGQQKKELVEKFNIAPAEKIHTIPLGFDLDRFAIDMPGKRRRFRSEFNLDEETISIGIIGRLVPVKNHDLFLDAINYVLANSSKKIRAFIIGDGETRTALEKKANQLGMSYTTERDEIHNSPLVFTSWRGDVDVIYSGLDIVCLTSFNEGTPVSLIEAQASNKPIISSRVGGIEDVVRVDKTALLSDLKDKRQFFNNLSRMVEDDRLREEFGVEGRNFVIDRFSYQRLVADMSELYHSLLKTNQ